MAFSTIAYKCNPDLQSGLFWENTDLIDFKKLFVYFDFVACNLHMIVTTLLLIYHQKYETKKS